MPHKTPTRAVSDGHILYDTYFPSPLKRFSTTTTFFTYIARTDSGAFSCNHIGMRSNGVGGTKLFKKPPELFNYEIEHDTTYTVNSEV